jgi:hypothetical protein
MYSPVAVFSDQIFIAKYDKELKTRDVDMVQYVSTLDSSGYKYHLGGILRVSTGEDGEEEGIKNSAVAETNLELGNKYLVSFVTKKGLAELVSRLESEANKINLDLWPVKV